MHPLFEQADRLSRDIIGAAIEVHRVMGPGLIEGIYERCLKLLDVPVGLLINFHELKLVDGIHRMILPGANR